MSHRASVFPFTELPTELQIECLAHLQPRELCDLCTVSSGMRDLASSDDVWLPVYRRVVAGRSGAPAQLDIPVEELQAAGGSVKQYYKEVCSQPIIFSTWALIRVRHQLLVMNHSNRKGVRLVLTPDDVSFEICTTTARFAFNPDEGRAFKLPGDGLTSEFQWDAATEQPGEMPPLRFGLWSSEREGEQLVLQCRDCADSSFALYLTHGSNGWVEMCVRGTKTTLWSADGLTQWTS